MRAMQRTGEHTEQWATHPSVARALGHLDGREPVCNFSDPTGIGARPSRPVRLMYQQSDYGRYCEESASSEGVST